MILENVPIDKFPVGRVKLLNPEGHSGHLKLQLVVGSMDTVMGYPLCLFIWNERLKWYENHTTNAFHILRKVNVRANCKAS
jgi:hypothetical protein